ncbi:hypothetical protein KR093_010562 [Drosophila rubida]|uniref:Uncharacterized protein n=1 Tax=Drosophila rubida TaxID=30044 RepID=A0AAD4PKZ5_9MUSC|nr:hypothetical protein KR093_010562 [Drosophila rubida]
MIKNKILNKMSKNSTVTAPSQEVNTTPTRSFTTPIAKADVTARPKLLLNLVNQLPKHRAMCGVSRPQARQQPTPSISQAIASPTASTPTTQPKPRQPDTPPVASSKPLIVLENKVLAPNEKIDLKELCLSKSASIALPPKVATEPEKPKNAPRILQLPGSGAKKVILNANKLKMSREQLSQLAKQISKEAEQHPVAKPKEDAVSIPTIQGDSSTIDLQTSLISPVCVKPSPKVEDSPATPVVAENSKSSHTLASSTSLSAVDFIAQLKASSSVNNMNLSAEEMSMSALFMGCDTPTSAAAIISLPSTPEPASTPIFPTNSTSSLVTIAASTASSIPVVSPSTPIASSSATSISVECNAEEDLPIGKILQMDDMDILHATVNVNENEPNVLCISPNAIKLLKSTQIEEAPVEKESTAAQPDLESEISLATAPEEPKQVEEVSKAPANNVMSKEEKTVTTRPPFRSKKGKINLVQRNKRPSIGKPNTIKKDVETVEVESAATNGSKEDVNMNLPEEMQEEEGKVGEQCMNNFMEENEEIAPKKSRIYIEDANESKVILNNVIKVSEQINLNDAENQRIEKMTTEINSEQRENGEGPDLENKSVKLEEILMEKIEVTTNTTIESKEGTEENIGTVESKKSVTETEKNLHISKTLISPKKDAEVELNNSVEETRVEEEPSNSSIAQNLSQLYHPPKMPKPKQKINNNEVKQSEEISTSSVSLMEVLSQEEPQPQGDAQVPFRQEVIMPEKATTEGKGIQNLLKHLAAENVVPISKENKDNKETKSEAPGKAPRKKLLKTRPVLNAKRASKAVPSKTEALHPRKRALLVENITNGVHRTSSTSDDDSVVFHGFDDIAASSKGVKRIRNTGTDISDDATPDYDETEEDLQPENDSIAKKPKADPEPAEKQLEPIPEQIDKEKSEEIPEQIDKEERQITPEHIDNVRVEAIPEQIDNDESNEQVKMTVISKPVDDIKQKESEKIDHQKTEAFSEPIDKEEIELTPESTDNGKLKVNRNPISKKKPKESQNADDKEDDAIDNSIDNEKIQVTPQPIEEKETIDQNQLDNTAMETVEKHIDQIQQVAEEKLPEQMDEEMPQTIPEPQISDSAKHKHNAVSKVINKKEQKQSKENDNQDITMVSQEEVEKAEDNQKKSDTENSKSVESEEPQKGKRKVTRKSRAKEKKDEDEKPGTTDEVESEPAETLKVELIVDKKKRGGRQKKAAPIAVVHNSTSTESSQNKTEEIKAAAPATRKRKLQDVRKSVDSSEDATKAELSASEVTPLAKRARRGRPGSATPLSTSSELATPTGRGRRSKTATAATTDGESTTDVVSSTPSKPEPKKPTGRPSKVKPAVSTDTENADTDFMASMAAVLASSTPGGGPRRRGRPSKHHDLVSLTTKLKTDEGAANEETLRQSFQFEGPDYWPKSVDINLRLFLARKREQLETDEDLREEGRGEGSIQCGLCFGRCEKINWKSHLAEHYGVGWPTDTVPLFVSRSILLSQMVVYTKTGQRLTCRLCARTFASGLGMLLHLENCGVTHERIECDLCKHLYSKSFIASHIRHCQKRMQAAAVEPESGTDTTADESTTVFSNAGRAKRKSTIKAETKLQKMAAQLKSDQKPNQDDFEGDSSEYDMNADKESSVEYESEGVDSNEEDDEAANSVEDDDHVRIKRKKPKLSGATSGSSEKILKSEGDLAVRWKYFIAKNYSMEALYANLLPYYEQLPPAEAIKLLPSRESSSMRYSYGHKADNDWQRLAPLEGLNKKDEYICHLGKPIKQLAWVPLPSSVETQYLLCSQRTKMLGFTRQFKDKQEDTLLLLLECKVASTGKQKETEWPLEMRLHYAIRVQGSVNSFQFMPSGGYDESTNRLGLLAVGSASGVVIYALPLLLTKCKTVDPVENAVVTLEAGLTLSLDITNPVQDPCTKICWSQASGHKLLVTGYASGNIAFWNLEDADGLNCIEQNNIRHLLPAHFFYFGERNIQNLELHYDTKGARWLAVGTTVRKYLVYDIANWSQPLAIIGDMVNNLFLGSITWSPLWNSLMIGCSQLTRIQFSRLISINPVESMPCRHVTLDVMLNTIRDMHFNYDQDMIASIADNGDVAFIKANEFCAECVLKRRKKKHTLITTEANFLGDDVEPKHVSPEVFQQDFGLLVRPIRHGLEKDKATSYQDPKREPSFGLRNMIRLNSVRWNWNPAAKGWVAVGAEHGLLRIINYESHD